MQPKFFKIYMLFVFITLLFLTALNFYEVLLVSPDTVDMKTFSLAILSSFGFWMDLLHFVFGLLLLHLFWAIILWGGTAGWLRESHIPARELKRLAFLCFLVSGLYILILSGRLYPNMSSGFLKHSRWMLSDITLFLLSGIIFISIVVSIFKLCQSNSMQLSTTFFSVAGALFLSWVGFGLYSSLTVAELKSESSKPNILIIGIDSLRPDETGFFGSDGELTPNVDEFLENSRVYENAFTPYARTFPAWMSVLTGLEPVNHKGRFNLINHKYLNKKTTIGHKLKKQGYRSIYAFDERRFNSMDESFGYDSVVGPKHAAWSFVASGFDHPIVNLLCNTVVGKYLFPGIHLNRGRHGNYDPEKYNQAIIDELTKDREKPVFLTAHFLLPHWPWISRDNDELAHYPTPKIPMADSLFRYRMMLKQADTQFGDFMAGLEKAGYLENTYVFLISDHGDGFNFEKDNLEPGVETNAILETNTRGHATNVFNLGQYRVIMAARHYGGDKFNPEVRGELSSLMDIYPTIMDLVVGHDEAVDPVDGVSMLAEATGNRQLFLETGFSFIELTTEDIAVEEVLKNGISAYTVDKEGRLVVKDNYYDLILASKHRAVMDGDWMLALVPSMGRYLVMVNRKTKQWWPIDFYEGEKDWKPMFKSMCEHYKGDVGFDSEGLCHDTSISLNH